MVRKTSVVALVWIVLCSLGAWAQGAKKDEPQTVSQVLNAETSRLEGEVVSAAEAMPEDKYSFAPTNGEFKGVRTFGQQVKHVAAVNYIVGGAMLGEKPPADTGGENGPDSIKTKADIIKYLKDSYAYAHKAIDSVNEQNLTSSIKGPFGEGTTTRLAMATLFSWHPMDHYGQMVVYLRMNGIIPPASRKQ